jgi:hypothetical protein
MAAAMLYGTPHAFNLQRNSATAAQLGGDDASEYQVYSIVSVFGLAAATPPKSITVQAQAAGSRNPPLLDVRARADTLIE